MFDDLDDKNNDNQSLSGAKNDSQGSDVSNSQNSLVQQKVSPQTVPAPSEVSQNKSKLPSPVRADNVVNHGVVDNRKSSPVEDMFSESDNSSKLEKPEIFQPKKDVIDNEIFDKEVNQQKSKKITLIISILGVVAISLGVFLGYTFFSKVKKQIEVVENPEVQPLKVEDNNIDNNSVSDEPASTKASPVAANIDTDGDGLLDSEEEALGTNIHNVDTDGDGLYDLDEVRVYNTDPLDKDTDKDGNDDGREVSSGFDPNGIGRLYNSGNLNLDTAKIDTDGDGLTDKEEVQVHRTDLTKIDTDGDGLTDGEEVNQYKTDPLNKDTDGDTFSDGSEVANGYNPKGPGLLVE